MSANRSYLKRISTTCAASVLALTIGLSAAHAAGDPQEFSIAAQPLAKALHEFSKQSNRDVIAPSEIVNGKESAGVSGEMSPEAALAKLLEGSGLRILEGEGGSLSIVPLSYVGGERKDRKKTTASADVKGSAGGHVIDGNSGMGLAGALVRIEETGQTTSTDDNGNFRFSRVAPGNYTLFISYLGYSTVISDFNLEKGEDFRGDYSLGKTTGDIEEIVVFGSRSARARALNQERMADNMSSVISADTLGNFTGTTIAEALRRVPGVSFQRDEFTGDGTNIMIRGMAPDMNAVKVNGLNLPVGNGLDRSANLGNILADSVEKITIHKSLLPSHDSSGTGGLIEIETKTPLGYDRRYANFSIERGARASGFSDDLMMSGTISGTFGSEDNFGLSASVQYRDQQNTNTSYLINSVGGKYLPLEQDGSLSITNMFQIDPRLAFPFDADAADFYPSNVGFNSGLVDTESLAITLSGEWRIKDHTDLTFQYQRSSRERDQFSRNLSIDGFAFYIPQPVASLDGEIRNALFWDGTVRTSQAYMYTPDQKDVTSTYSLRGRTAFDQWEFNYTLGYVQGASSTPNQTRLSFNNDNSLDASHLLPGATDAIEGRVLSPFGIRVGRGSQLPLLTEAGWALITDPTALQFVNGVTTGWSGSNKRYTAEVSARYDLNHDRIKYIEAGIDFESSKFTNKFDDFSSYTGISEFIFDPCCSMAWPSIDSFGLSLDDTGALAHMGIPRDLAFVSLAQLQAFFLRLPDLATGDDAPVNLYSNDQDPRYFETYTREDNLAAYIQTRLEFGKLEIIGGARLSRVEIDALTFTSPSVTDEFGVEDQEFAAEFARLSLTKGLATDILPRVLFNYRESDNLVFRAGYFLSTARPSIGDLNRNQKVRLMLEPNGGPDFNQPTLSVGEGNPDLKPAITHNFDFSVEYYHDQIGVIKIGAFYKQINNLLQNNFTAGLNDLSGFDLPDHPYFDNLPDNLFISTSRPENSPYSARIWGFEAHMERQFTFLPGFLSGLGMYANYTYTDSSKTETYDWMGSPVLDENGNTIPAYDWFGNQVGIERESVNIEFPDTPFDQQAKHSGTAALTYNLHNIDATLSYTFQSRLRRSFAPNNLIAHKESVQTLDFRAEYRFDIGGTNYRFYVIGEDLLKGTRDPDLLQSVGGVGSTPKAYTDGTYLGGRVMKVGLAASF
jgi:TonB-dependent receptor